MLVSICCNWLYSVYCTLDTVYKKNKVSIVVTGFILFIVLLYIGHSLKR